MRKALRYSVLIFLFFVGYLHSGLLINEVSKGALQWIEIYNTSGVSVNITGWLLRNAQGEDTLTGEVKGNGYIVITPSKSGFLAEFPGVTCTIIELKDGTIGGGLNASQDMIALLNPYTEVVDLLNWGDPNPNWKYYTQGLWSTGIDPSYQLIARIPNARDRDLPEDFKYVAEPTPGDENSIVTGLPSNSWGKIKALFSKKFNM